jgi:hypothetical protein
MSWALRTATVSEAGVSSWTHFPIEQQWQDPAATGVGDAIGIVHAAGGALVAHRLESDGSRLGPGVAFAPAVGTARLAAIGARGLAVWSDETGGPTGPHPLLHARIDFSVDPPVIQAPAMLFPDVRSPGVVVLGGRFVVTYLRVDGSSGTWRLFGRFVDP